MDYKIVYQKLFDNKKRCDTKIYEKWIKDLTKLIGNVLLFTCTNFLTILTK